MATDAESSQTPSQPPMQSQEAVLTSLPAPPTLQGQLVSRPATAATSMVTMVPNDDEKTPAPSGRPSQDVEVVTEDPHPTDSGVSPLTPPSPTQPIPQTPQTSLKFLLVSGKWKVMSFEPSTTIGRVKELVWNAWQSEWPEERPPAPSYLWLLHLGKVLQDDDTLSGLSFPATTPPSPPRFETVHLWIRTSLPPVEDESTLKKKARRALGRSNTTGRVPSLRGRGGPTTATPGADPGTGDSSSTGGCCGCVIC